jgi:hypothetical protein
MGEGQELEVLPEVMKLQAIPLGSMMHFSMRKSLKGS